MENNAEGTEKVKLAFGTLCVDVRQLKDVYESFILDPSAAEIGFIEMRATMNSHRNYRFFSFNCTDEQFASLKKLSEQNEDKFIEWLKTTESVMIRKTI